MSAIPSWVAIQAGMRLKYSDDQPRDENGRFASGGGDSEGTFPKADHEAAAKLSETAQAATAKTEKDSQSGKDAHAHAAAAQGHANNAIASHQSGKTDETGSAQEENDHVEASRTHRAAESAHQEAARQASGKVAERHEAAARAHKIAAESHEHLSYFDEGD